MKKAIWTGTTILGIGLGSWLWSHQATATEVFEPVTLNVEVQVRVEGKEATEHSDFEFAFVLEQLSEEQEVLNEKISTTGVFPDLMFAEAGVFPFRVRQVLDELERWTLDDRVFYMEIVVPEGGEPNIHLPELVFTNIYHPFEFEPLTLELGFYLSANNPDFNFRFLLDDVEVDVTEMGYFEFEIPLMEPGEFVFRLSQIMDDLERWTLDDSVFDIQVYVPKVGEPLVEMPELVFTNHYEPYIPYTPYEPEPVEYVAAPPSSGIPENYAAWVSNEDALSYLALVNRHFRLSSSFTPHDLSTVQVNSTGGTHLMRYSAARAMEILFAEASYHGHTLIARSGFRSYATQQSTHHHWINVMGETEARRVSARPGHSEHQLGLALDISTHSLNGELRQSFSATAEGTWVRYNAHRFGFIVRYPYNREADTGFIYEPWHLRFVGVDSATAIFYGGLILEEYL